MIIFYVIENVSLKSKWWWSSEDINYVFQEKVDIERAYPQYQYIVSETNISIPKDEECDPCVQKWHKE